MKYLKQLFIAGVLISCSGCVTIKESFDRNFRPCPVILDATEGKSLNSAICDGDINKNCVNVCFDVQDTNCLSQEDYRTLYATNEALRPCYKRK